MSRPDIEAIEKSLAFMGHASDVGEGMLHRLLNHQRALLDYVAELEEQRDELEAANLTFGKAMQELEGYRSRDNGYMKRALEAQKG